MIKVFVYLCLAGMVQAQVPEMMLVATVAKLSVSRRRSVGEDVLARLHRRAAYQWGKRRYRVFLFTLFA